jgi:hypothetical protein
MALSLRDVRRDPVANRGLAELMHHYTVAEEKGPLGSDQEGRGYEALLA